MQGIGLGIGLAKEEEAPFVSKVNFSSELLPSKGEGPIQNPNGRLQALYMHFHFSSAIMIRYSEVDWKLKPIDQWN